MRTLSSRFGRLPEHWLLGGKEESADFLEDLEKKWWANFRAQNLKRCNSVGGQQVLKSNVLHKNNVLLCARQKD